MAALIDAISEMPEFGVDRARIAMLGFSLGGHTALALAGARIRMSDYARYCDRNPDAPDCQWFARGNKMIPGHVDLHKVDAAAADADHGDMRIKVAVAVDPALAQAYQSESLRQVAVPVQIVNLGTGNGIPLGIRGEQVASIIPGARYEAVANAHHFSFLGLCKPQGARILKDEGDDPVCGGETSRSREDLHEEIADRIAKFLKARL